VFIYCGCINLRLTHEHRGFGRKCNGWLRSHSVESLCQEFGDRVLVHVHLNDGWKRLVVVALQFIPEEKDVQMQRDKLTRALENLRNQHLWGDISDDDYRREQVTLEVFAKVTIYGTSLVAIEPKPSYAPLFAAMLM
jgi:hypothetical protein